MQALGGKHRDLPCQRQARVRGHRLAVEVIHRHQHLAARRLRAESGTSVPGIGQPRRSPSPVVPDQPGLVDVLAGDVEAEDGDRHMPAAVEDAHQFVAAHDLAAADAIGVGEHDVEGLDLGMGVEKGLRLGGRGARR